MKTNQEMVRQMGNLEVIQRTVDGYFNATRLVKLWNELHIPADTRSAFPVISVQSPVSIQCCWQS